MPFEIVISDDSDDGVAAVEELAKRFGARYVRGPRRGLYANRNCAAMACRGSHVRTMDDDHTFPADHLEACLAAISSDPESVWVLGEFFPWDERPNEIAPCPGQLHPRGFSVTPTDTQSSWAIADGATIYPRSVFERGIRYAEDFAFGASFLEFGSRLRWLGYRMRHLESTYVVHHADDSARAIKAPEVEDAARVFAMLCHSFMYQPTVRNKALTVLELIRRTLMHPLRVRRIFAPGFRGYARRRDEPAPGHAS